ncbi:hypothetical protein A2U01_0099814, partial [Trifolium medium]|nr:hypothetical protein [Trifolium medium]
RTQIGGGAAVGERGHRSVVARRWRGGNNGLHFQRFPPTIHLK